MPAAGISSTAERPAAGCEPFIVTVIDHSVTIPVLRTFAACVHTPTHCGHREPQPAQPQDPVCTTRMCLHVPAERSHLVHTAQALSPANHATESTHNSTATIAHATLLATQPHHHNCPASHRATSRAVHLPPPHLILSSACGCSTTRTRLGFGHGHRRAASGRAACASFGACTSRTDNDCYQPSSSKHCGTGTH